MAQKVAHTNPRDTSWPVKMAQYVPPPSADAFASLLPFFKRRRGSNLPGTWLSSKSMATVTLSSSSNGIGPSIALILQGQVHEEHLLSNLAFTWPRFKDENEDTSSPGRVIFGSYKKTCSNQKQKFAMQFETVLQAEWFFKTVKQLIDRHNGAVEGTSNVGIQQANSGSQEIFETYPLGTVTAFAGHGTSMITSHEAMSTRTSNLPANVLPLSELSSSTSSTVVLPPRFPSLDTQHHSFRAHNIVSEQQEGESSTMIADGLQNEQLLKEKLKVCFLDPEFQDFVGRVERIWHSMEEELATELSSIK